MDDKLDFHVYLSDANTEHDETKERDIKRTTHSPDLVTPDPCISQPASKEASRIRAEAEAKFIAAAKDNAGNARDLTEAPGKITENPGKTIE